MADSDKTTGKKNIQVLTKQRLMSTRETVRGENPTVEELPRHVCKVHSRLVQIQGGCLQVTENLRKCLRTDGDGYEQRMNSSPEKLLARAFSYIAKTQSTSTFGQMLSACAEIAEHSAVQSTVMDMAVEETVLPNMVSYSKEILSLDSCQKKMATAKADYESVQNRNTKSPNGSSSSKTHCDLDELRGNFVAAENQYISSTLGTAARECSLADTLMTYMELKLSYHEQVANRFRQAMPQLREIARNCATRPVFGVPLEDHLSHSGSRIATVISSCCEHLRDHLSAEGIFRKAAPTSHVKKVKACFDFGITNLEGVNHHTVAGVLKLYLRELPDALLLTKNYDTWVTVGNISDPASRLLKMCEHVSALPTANRDNLWHLLCFLNTLSKYEETNKMSTSNIGVIFAPTLIFKKDPEELPGESLANITSSLARVVEDLIENVNYFFPPVSDTEKPPKGHDCTTVPEDDAVTTVQSIVHRFEQLHPQSEEHLCSSTTHAQKHSIVHARSVEFFDKESRANGHSNGSQLTTQCTPCRIERGHHLRSMSVSDCQTLPAARHCRSGKVVLPV